jgi:hypothetical protein
MSVPTKGRRDIKSAGSNEIQHMILGQRLGSAQSSENAEREPGREGSASGQRHRVFSEQNRASKKQEACQKKKKSNREDRGRETI